jgi:hypothetical protein
MALERIPPEHLMVELLDRVLDKGVVIDAATRISVVGIQLMDVDTRMVVASFLTYLDHAETHASAVRDAKLRVRQVGQNPVASDVLIEMQAHVTPREPEADEGVRQPPVEPGGRG